MADSLRELNLLVLRACRRRWGSSWWGISAEDIAQEVMLAVHRNAGGLVGDDLARYTQGIIRNKVNDALKRACARQQHELLIDALPEWWETGSTVDQPPGVLDADLLSSLAGMSERQRTVLLLRHWYGYSVAEVAELLSMKPSTVRVAAYDGAAAARRILAGRSLAVAS